MPGAAAGDDTSNGANTITYVLEPFRVETLGPWGPSASLSISRVLHVTIELVFFCLLTSLADLFLMLWQVNEKGKDERR